MLTEFYQVHINVFRAILSVVLHHEISDSFDSEIKNTMVNMLSNNKMYFRGKTYIKKGKKGNSIGHLGRNIIATYALESTDNFDDFKNKIATYAWGSPWLDEVILEGDIEPKNKDHFFLNSSELIKWHDGTSFSIAKYWLAEDVRNLALLLNMNLY